MGIQLRALYETPQYDSAVMYGGVSGRPLMGFPETLVFQTAIHYTFDCCFFSQAGANIDLGAIQLEAK